MWAEHVDGGVNATERGAGTGADSPVARALGTGLPTVEAPLWPQYVRPATADEWLAWFQQLRGAPWPREEGVCSKEGAWPVEERSYRRLLSGSLE